MGTVQAGPMYSHRDPSSEAGQGFVEEVRGLVKENKKGIWEGLEEKKEKMI